MNKITINGQTYISESGDVNIAGGTVMIDGVVQAGSVSGVVEVRVIEGSINSLTSSASVTCGNVTGNVKANGSVRCNDVGGNVTAGGSARCDDVGGNVAAGGSVRHG